MSYTTETDPPLVLDLQQDGSLWKVTLNKKLLFESADKVEAQQEYDYCVKHYKDRKENPRATYLTRAARGLE